MSQPEQQPSFARRFWPLFGAQSLGAFADNTLRMATIAITTAAFTAGATSSGFYLPFGMAPHSSSVISAAFTLPVFLFSIIAGQYADKIDRQHLIRRLKVVELGLMIMAATFFALGNGLALVITLFLMGAQSAFFSPVRNAVMPQYYGPKELARTNGYYNAALGVAIVAGLMIGAGFITQDGGRIIISACLIVAAAIGAACAQGCPPAPPPGLKTVDWNLPRAAQRQAKTILRMPGLAMPILGIGWYWLVSAIFLANLPNLIQVELGRPPAEFGIVLPVAAIGGVIGSLASGALVNRLQNPMILSFIGAAGTAMGSMALWLIVPTVDSSVSLLSATNAPLLLAFFVSAAANGLFVVPLVTAMHQRAPVEARAQVMGVSNMVNGGGASLQAVILIPFVAAGQPPSAVFAGLAVLQIILCLYLYARWRQRRDEPESQITAEAAISADKGAVTETQD